jgi:membrane-bound metal-dependent hydrolase YbcI (DUF457 family)
VLLLAGVERARVAPGDTAFTPLAFDHYPWSHSLLMVGVQAALLAGLYAARGARDARDARGGVRVGALVLAAVVVSHWLLDWVTHRPDLPLAPGLAQRTGLGLWHSVTATLLVEGALFAAGVLVYLRTTRARDRAGRWGLAALLLFLVVIQVANAFGPPPPSMTAVAVSALAMWLLVAWAALADRRRTADAVGRGRLA